LTHTVGYFEYDGKEENPPKKIYGYCLKFTCTVSTSNSVSVVTTAVSDVGKHARRPRRHLPVVLNAARKTCTRPSLSQLRTLRATWCRMFENESRTGLLWKMAHVVCRNHNKRTIEIFGNVSTPFDTWPSVTFR